MKRLLLLLLAVILSFSTTGFSPPVSATEGSGSTSAFGPPGGVDQTGLAASIPGYNIVCHNVRNTRLCVSVSSARVRPGSFVTIYGLIRRSGLGVQGQIMRVIWASHVTATCIGVTDETGLASCTTYVPASTPSGKKVHVKVWIDKYKLMTSFHTPHARAEEDSRD